MKSCCLFALVTVVSSTASAAPINVQQNNAQNVVSVIQQRSTMIAIDRSVTASNGRTTVTEIVRIGPEPDPVRIQQSGIVNLSSVYQQGRSPRLDLLQQGQVNRERTFQYHIP